MAWWHWLWAHFLQQTGIDSASSRAYNFWSGFMGGLPALGFFGAGWAVYRAHQCHVGGCYRIVRHTTPLGWRLCHRCLGRPLDDLRLPAVHDDHLPATPPVPVPGREAGAADVGVLVAVACAAGGSVSWLHRWVWPTGGSGGIPGDIVGSLVWAAAAGVVVTLLWPRARHRVERWLHTHLSRHVGPLNDRLDHIIQHHPDIPPMPGGRKRT